MNKRLINNEFKSSLFQFIIFSLLILGALTASFVAYEFLNDDIINKIKDINSNVKILFYLNDNIINGNEYYCFIMEYLLILGSIMASHMATRQILWDKKNNYDEYLFTLPVSRGRIFFNKCMCLLIEILIFNALFYILSIILTNVSTYHVSIRYILEINTAMLLSQLTFASLGLLAGSLIRHPRFIYIKSDIVLFFFILLAIPERIWNIKLIKYVNPFSYLAVRDILLNDGYKLSFLIASGCIMIFSITISKSIYDEYEI